MRSTLLFSSIDLGVDPLASIELPRVECQTRDFRQHNTHAVALGAVFIAELPMAKQRPKYAQTLVILSLATYVSQKFSLILTSIPGSSVEAISRYSTLAAVAEK